MTEQIAELWLTFMCWFIMLVSALACMASVGVIVLLLIKFFARAA